MDAGGDNALFDEALPDGDASSRVRNCETRLLAVMKYPSGSKCLRCLTKACALTVEKVDHRSHAGGEKTLSASQYRERNEWPTGFVIDGLRFCP